MVIRQKSSKLVEIEAKMESNIQIKNENEDRTTQKKNTNTMRMADGWTIYMLNEWILLNAISLAASEYNNNINAIQKQTQTMISFSIQYSVGICDAERWTVNLIS